MRSALIWIVGSIWCVVMVIVALLLQAFDFKHVLVPRLTRFWARWLLRLTGVRLEVTGLEHIPLDQGALLVSNHQGTFDIVALLATMPGKTVFVSKRENFWIPFIGWHLWAAGYVSLDRQNRRAAVRSLEQAKRAVARGWRVGIFPEGTRSKDGLVHSFKKGAFATAIDGQMPLVPIALDGSQNVLRKHSWQISGGVIRMAIAAPISTEGMTETDRTPLLCRVREQIIALQRSVGGAGALPGAPHVAGQPAQPQARVA